jgi:hypothetical protein
MLMAVEVLALLAELDDAITESTASMIALQYVKEDYEELRAELATRNSQNDELYKHMITAVNHLRAICYETDAAGPEIIAAERWLAGQIDTALVKVEGADT